MRGRTITGLVAAFALGTLVVFAAGPPSAPARDYAPRDDSGPAEDSAPALSADTTCTSRPPSNRATFWPCLQDGGPVLTEWYSDVPWHQKLGTYVGNEINEPLVLPYEALEEADKKFCTDRGLANKPEACILEVGVVNVIATLRTDSLYGTNDPKIQAAPECQRDATLPCIEVKLELSSRWTKGTGELHPRLFGKDPENTGGATITDGTTYAPQMLWEMAHYCDALFAAGDALDTVCYGDYFSTFNNGFNLFGSQTFDQWPHIVMPWSVFPPDAPSRNHCKPGELKCTLVLGGFGLRPVPPSDQGTGTPAKLQYKRLNDLLLFWFNDALKKFPLDFVNDTRHFPWLGGQITWKDFIHPLAVANPFLGEYDFVPTIPHPGCGIDVAPTETGNNGCPTTDEYRAKAFLYPRQCTLDDLAGAAKGQTDKVERLRQCGLNWELHPNGWKSQWPPQYQNDPTLQSMLTSNQYGRTTFVFAGVPGLQLPASFYKHPTDGSGLSVYERVYNASIFSLYLPVANVADSKRAVAGRNYADEGFYHTLLMTNHMESKPELFAEGIRGKVLWHNEYRTQDLFKLGEKFPTRTFAAAFKPADAKVPYHNNTCDGCHVRNGSGVPVKPPLDPAVQEFTLDPALQEFMTAGPYKPLKDYTFASQIQPMKLVFFDLKRRTSGLDGSRYSEPLSFPPSFALTPLVPSRPRGEAQDDDNFYNNKIMNFYGDSFHVTKPMDYNYKWSYVPATSSRIVVNTQRHEFSRGKDFIPQQIAVTDFQTKACVAARDLLPQPPTSKPWPTTCADISKDAIDRAINVVREVGVMLLNGKRLGNLSAMEAIPNTAIIGFRNEQIAALGQRIAGELIWQAGSRDGLDPNSIKKCATTTKDLTECYIGRFGWLGDRVSLEDQVANAAFVEMNITTSEGAKKLTPRGPGKSPIRYDHPNCGPANKVCNDSKSNGDLSEKDVARMAEYARWLGNPTRSEFKVSRPGVIAGEAVFRRLKCDTCHVIKKIEISNPDDTMLSSDFRERLKGRAKGLNLPFLSYIGTDLLMHDMGYLSQVADASGAIRDGEGVVINGFENYVQKIRTPALKGLGYNRFVTDSHKNTKNAGDAACDFLLHDGRACDAIEAAFLHDGPAIKKLGVIEGLSRLSEGDLIALRAFLYSL
jgi:CxxC motif-containing protein (DUF1111 family)